MRLIPQWVVCMGLLSACHEVDSVELDESDHTLSIANAPAIEHGAAWFGARVEADFTSSALHAWTFELTAPAKVQFATEGSATGPDLDTILYLYRERASRWGSYVARNDDRADSQFSFLERSLKPGRYRVVARRVGGAVGSFVFSASCEGAGCRTPVQPSSCVFGEQLEDLPALLPISTVQTMQSADHWLDTWLPLQLMSAARDTPLGLVQTPAQLFSRVDNHLVHWFRVWDHAAGRDFRGFAFRVAGDSYGALFAPTSAEPVARVRDSVFSACTVPVQRCAFGTTYHELREHPDFELASSAKLTAASIPSLPALQQAQLLEAVRVAYEDAGDVDAAFASVDQGEVNRLVFTRSDGTRVVAYEYGAGDNSYGAIFELDSTTMLARINDGDLLGCTLWNK